MRKILIVGAGQAGLQLALGLQQRGYDVTVVSDRTPDGIAAGKVMSSQCMFGTALQTERRLGIDLWSGICPTVDGIQLTVPGPDGSAAVHWAARLAMLARCLLVS
jgi:2-polyprenyl-6-methoxyphenol hydroxylase-like FAD-dependent oxidoreductase